MVSVGNIERQAILFVEFFRRSFTTQYLGSMVGLVWALIHPLILLAIYAFVFTVIFKAKIPEADMVGFVPYLAIGLWPWLMFSDSLLRSTSVIKENAAIIAKVSVPKHLLVLSAISVPFVLHFVGFLLVLVVLALTGVDIQWINLFPLILVLCLLFVLVSSAALILSSLQVFIRDIEQILPSCMMILFFLTPIIYSSSLIPEKFQSYVALNPMAGMVAEIRAMLLDSDWTVNYWNIIIIPLLFIFSSMSWLIFQRLSPYFEDYL